jgi:predicted ArsR family transcriptional regulator
MSEYGVRSCMDVTNTPDWMPSEDEEVPDFDAWESPEGLLKGGPTRERMLDVVLQLREPAKVSDIAERADCDTETARDYLEWFTRMGVVCELPGRPVRYERNDSYLNWRRVEQIRQQYSESEIVERLKDTLAAAEEYRERFGAESPDAVSLVDANRERAVEDVWEAVANWKTLEERAALLDAARQDEVSGGRAGRVNAGG